MKILFTAISLAALVPGVGHSDIFEFHEHEGSSSGAGKSEWLLLDDDREATADPYPWGITAICDGKGGYEFSIALHGIVSERPRAVELTYRVGEGEPIVTQGFALDSLLTGLAESFGTEVTKAVASGQRIILNVVSDSGTWSSDFEGYEPDPDRVAFVSNGCQ